MNTPLYDLFDDQQRFLMRAPLFTIGAIFKLTSLAYRCIDEQTKAEGLVYEFHMNGRPHPFSGKSFVIQRAVGARGQEVHIRGRDPEGYRNQVSED